MGELRTDLKENAVCSGLQAENRKPKARAQETALLQKSKRSGPMTGKHGNLGGVAVVRVEVPEDSAAFLTNRSHAAELNAAEEPLEQDRSSVSSPSLQHFVEIVEQKLAILLTDRVDFYERAGRELTSGKVDKTVLAKLLQLEKAKLQKHRTAVDELHQAFLRRRASTKNQEILGHGQLIVHKLGELLCERENFHLKFEVQVELGHFFRLVKLLELQKSRHELFRKAVDKILLALRGAVEQENRELQKDRCCFSPSSDSQSCHLSELRLDACEQVIRALTKAGSKPELKCHKELKTQMVRLFEEQEQHWQARQRFVDEIERKLALAEQESRRLAEILKDRRWESRRGRQVEKHSWTSNLPAGYASFYISPLYQEQIGTPLPQLDSEVCKLREEVSSLKIQLKDDQMQQKDGAGDQRHFSEWADETPTVDKTISVESLSSENELDKIWKYLQLEVEEGETSRCILSDRRFLRTAVHDLLKLFQQHPKTECLDELHLRVFKHINELSGELQHQMGKINENEETISRNIELENHVEALKNELARITEDHHQQLQAKSKALQYAQELNLQLASDLSATRSAFSELRGQCRNMKASFEARLEDSIAEACVLFQNLKKQFDGLEELQLKKEQEIQAAKRRAETCQCGTELRNNNEALARIQTLTEELEKQSSCLEQAEAKLAALAIKNRQSEHSNIELTREVSTLKEEAESLKEENDHLRSRILDMEYKLVQREEAVERLTVHLALVMESHSAGQERTVETLRSKHLRRQLARNSILEVEEKMARMAAQAKLEMEDMKACMRRIQCIADQQQSEFN